MIKGLYTSASGMLPRIKKQELTAHNIANVGTPGYKRDMLFTRELSRAEQKLVKKQADWQKPIVNEVFTDYAAGAFDHTGNPLDLAIDGDGFFTLQLADGSRALTRAGSFTVDNDGLLIFPGGALVMGEGGAIEVGNGKVMVSQSGGIEVDGFVVNRIVPVTAANLDELTKIGNGLFLVPEGVELMPVQTATVRQGYLESANVDIVHEMIEMIISFREYEANARAVQAQDQSLEHLFNRVGGTQG
ncbi:MAG: flagellar hook-basal body protein [Candidatus Zixiibacteriota bacterium]